MALALRRKRESLTRDEEPDLTPLLDCVFLLDLARDEARRRRTASQVDDPYNTNGTTAEYFDNAVLMVAMVKAGVELAFEEMVNVGMKFRFHDLRYAHVSGLI